MKLQVKYLNSILFAFTSKALSGILLNQHSIDDYYQQNSLSLLLKEKRYYYSGERTAIRGLGNVTNKRYCDQEAIH